MGAVGLPPPEGVAGCPGSPPPGIPVGDGLLGCADGPPPGWVVGCGSYACCAAAGEAVASAARTAKLIAVRSRVVRGAVVRRFLRNCDIMRVALLHTRCGYLNEPGSRSELFQGSTTAVPHSGSKAAD